MDLIHVQRKWYERLNGLPNLQLIPAILSHAEEEEVDSILPKPFTAATPRPFSRDRRKFNPRHTTAIQW